MIINSGCENHTHTQETQVIEIEKTRQEKIKTAYNLASKSYADHFFFELYDKPIDRKFYDLFAERVMNQGIVLEIGCGPGEIANYLKMNGLNIIGIDISEGMIEVARELNPRIEFQVGDVFNLGFADGSIAGIVAPYLIVNFQLDDVPRAFAELRRVLMPGGRLLLSFHTGGNDSQELKDFFVAGNHLRFTFFDPEVIRQMLLTQDFSIDEYIIRGPYEGEVTTRAYIFARRK